MANVKGGTPEDLSEHIPNVCTNSPAPGLAFCREHGSEISKLGYPTGLWEFLKSCSVKGEDTIDPDNYSKSMQQKVDSVLKDICNKITASSKFKSCIDAQGDISIKFIIFPEISFWQELDIFSEIGMFSTKTQYR